MREALVVVGEEGLDHMWARHLAMHKQLWEGLAEMGLEPFVENPAERLVTVNTIKARPLPCHSAPAAFLFLKSPIWHTASACLWSCRAGAVFWSQAVVQSCGFSLLCVH